MRVFMKPKTSHFKPRKVDTINALEFSRALLQPDYVPTFQKVIRKKRDDVPTEEWEQKQLVKWLGEQELEFFVPAQSTYTTSWKQINKNKAMGVSRGVPDVWIYYKNELLVIELKRQKKSYSNISKEQEHWIELLNTVSGIKAVVCYGHQEAIDFIKNNLVS